ncbi:disintegrin and metalloproteinase domain-containing protein 12-like isoform X2 [Branchiostoma lanceolatum]|uniref:disintegrin and metalloproteinase domain-containing protein 12-like isoform X2 n=1 Tax=Branchiostoma lanceolatum TaxID=7740 RepID=UPI00345330D1
MSKTEDYRERPIGRMAAEKFLFSSKTLRLFLILAFSWTVGAADRDQLEWQSLQGRARQLGKLRHYEEVEAYRLGGRHRRDVNTLTKRGHMLQGVFKVKGFNMALTLDVRLNRNLFGKHYFEKYYLSDGTPVVEWPSQQNHCHYHGTVRGEEGSTVALSTCNGISGVIHLANETFYIEPLQNSTEQHIMYRTTDINMPRRFCGHDSVPDPIEIDFATEKKRVENARMRRQVMESRTETKYVELIMVADNMEYQKYDSNRQAVLDRLQEAANIADSIYKTINMRVALMGIEVWTSGNPIDITAVASETMYKFLDWRQDNLLPDNPDNDNAQLITGITFQGSTVGMAPLSSMCSAGRSGGVDEDHGVHAAAVASTMAHEMGHNLGMNHDTSDRGCACSASYQEGGCVMEPAAGSQPAAVFSSCSSTDLQNALLKGVGACLYNLPNPDQLYGGPVCGNGYLEEGEDCDCGTVDECTSPCCDPSTCTLQENATCAIGLCCEGCQLVSAGTLCRDDLGDCDLPEYCTGTSPHCPPNVFIQDGYDCLYEEGYCFNGACLTHEAQCKETWGDAGEVAEDVCYSLINTKGDVYGNCGKDENDQYIPCDEIDIKCGKLQCQGGTVYPIIGSNAATIESKIPWEGEMITCRGAYIDLGDDMPDPGLVLTGTKCGEGKICYNRQCQEMRIVDIGIKPCNCSGHGVCNSNHHCHCDPGWAPPYCNITGHGGSVDSGPVQPTHRDKTLTIVLLVLFLFIFPATGISIFLCWFFRDKIRAKMQNYKGKKYKETASGGGASRPSVKFNNRRANITAPTYTIPTAPPNRPPPPRASVPKGQVTKGQVLQAPKSDTSWLRPSLHPVKPPGQNKGPPASRPPPPKGPVSRPPPPGQGSRPPPPSSKPPGQVSRPPPPSSKPPVQGLRPPQAAPPPPGQGSRPPQPAPPPPAASLPLAPKLPSTVIPPSSRLPPPRQAPPPKPAADKPQVPSKPGVPSRPVYLKATPDVAVSHPKKLANRWPPPSQDESMA